MKYASLRVRTLVEGLLYIFVGLLVGAFVGYLHLAAPLPISWGLGATVFTTFFTLSPIGLGIYGLLGLCAETEEDHKYQAEVEQLVRELQELEKEDPIPNLRKPIEFRIYQPD